MDFGEKKFVKLIYLISRNFLAWNFLIFLAHYVIFVTLKMHPHYFLLHYFPLFRALCLEKNNEVNGWRNQTKTGFSLYEHLIQICIGLLLCEY